MWITSLRVTLRRLMLVPVPIKMGNFGSRHLYVEDAGMPGKVAFDLPPTAVPSRQGYRPGAGSPLTDRVPVPGMTLYAMGKSSLTGLTRTAISVDGGFAA
jgi:hypothetical protein